MKKIFNVFMTLAMFITAGMTLTACSKDDNPTEPSNPTKEVTEAELKEALVGLQIDATDFVVGTETLRVWDLKADNTFTVYDLYYDDQTFVVDTIPGAWKPLANQKVWWDETATDKLQGFTVVYGNFEGMSYEIDEPDEAFFGFLTEDDDDSDDDDGELFFLSESALNLLALLDQMESEDDAPARTRAAQSGSKANDAISTIGQCLADGVTSSDMKTKESAQKFYDSMRTSLDKAKQYFNPNNHPTSTDTNLDNGEGIGIEGNTQGNWGR